MKNKKKRKNNIKILIVCFIIVFFAAGILFLTTNTKNENHTHSLLNQERIMADGTYQIRFSDLVSLEALQEYKDKTVTAIGYLSPITSYDGSFGYLMNLPYQTCPYCLPSDTKITNTIAIFAKNGKQIEFTEAAVLIRGTLKLEPYTDEYGYSYNYRIIDATIEEADTSELGEKIVLYNQLAEKEILTRLMNSLYSVDDNVFYDEYTANGAVYDRQIVSTEQIIVLIDDLKEFDANQVNLLSEVAQKLKVIAEETNAYIEQKEYDKLLEYKERTIQLFYDIGDWMSLYEL